MKYFRSARIFVEANESTISTNWSSHEFGQESLSPELFLPKFLQKNSSVIDVLSQTGKCLNEGYHWHLQKTNLYLKSDKRIVDHSHLFQAQD